MRTSDNGKTVVSCSITTPLITVAPEDIAHPSWMWVCFTFSIMFSKVWNCRKPPTTQLSSNFTAFQSEHCMGSVTIVRCPIWHPIHRKIGFARIVPAQKFRGPWHQTKKQSCAKK